MKIRQPIIIKRTLFLVLHDFDLCILYFVEEFNFMILLFVEERQNAPSDLDSLTAQQLDEKFKEIMMKKRGTYVNIYIDNYSFYHSVCSHLVVHRGVSPNHLYMNCHVTLIKLREISSSLSKKKKGS